MKRGINEISPPPTTTTVVDPYVNYPYPVYPLEKKFEQFFSTKNPLNEKMLREVKILLDNGENPNFCLESPFKGYHFISPLYYAILVQDIKLFNLLLENKVNIMLPCSKRIFARFNSNENFFDISIKQHVLPIQKTLLKILKSESKNSNLNKEILYEMYHALLARMKNEMPWIFDELEKEIENTYCSIFELFHTELKKSQDKGKKLYILIGEGHDSKHAYAIETMFLLIAKSISNSNNLLVETNETTLKIVQNANSNRLLPRLIKLANQEKIQITPMDLAHDGPIDIKMVQNKTDFNARRWSVSAEGLKHRNEVMSDVAILTHSNNLIGIVGGNHLYGLVKETNLANHFHCVCINVFFEMEKYTIKTHKYNLLYEEDDYYLDPLDIKYHQLTAEFRNSDKVTQLKIHPTFSADALSTLLSDEALEKIILKIHRKKSSTSKVGQPIHNGLITRFKNYIFDNTTWAVETLMNTLPSYMSPCSQSPTVNQTVLFSERTRQDAQEEATMASQAKRQKNKN